MRLQGSYTVEASLIVPMVLFSIVFILYSAFYMHNQAVIKEAAYETAIYGTVLYAKNTEEMKRKMQEKYRNSIDGRLIAMKKPVFSIKADNKGVTVSIKGKMTTGPLWFLPGYNQPQITAEKQVSYRNPVQKIRLTKELKKKIN